MCMKSSIPKASAPAVLKAPEPTATQEEVTAARKAEDDALFGGTPDLRTDRSATPESVKGSGLTIPE